MATLMVPPATAPRPQRRNPLRRLQHRAAAQRQRQPRRTGDQHDKLPIGYPASCRHGVVRRHESAGRLWGYPDAQHNHHDDRKHNGPDSAGTTDDDDNEYDELTNQPIALQNTWPVSAPPRIIGMTALWPGEQARNQCPSGVTGGNQLQVLLLAAIVILYP
jgi:hypothetical protein